MCTTNIQGANNDTYKTMMAIRDADGDLEMPLWNVLMAVVKGSFHPYHKKITSPFGIVL